MARIGEARSLAKSGRIAEALQLTAELLGKVSDCPYVLVLRSRLIQLDESGSSLTLTDAERCLLAALDVDPMYLPALEDLAHYYDAVMPDHGKARLFAGRYAEVAGKQLEEMQLILNESVPLTSNDKR